MTIRQKKFSEAEIQILQKAITIAKKHLKREGFVDKSRIGEGIANIKEDFGIK